MPLTPFDRQAIINAGGDPAQGTAGVEQEVAMAGLRNQEQQGREQALPFLQQGMQQADTRSQVLQSQLEQSGLAGVAEQFRRANKARAFETARRGTRGGSRDIERGVRTQQAAQGAAGDVIANAQAQAEQQRQGDLGHLFGIQQNLEQGGPFSRQAVQTGLQGQNLEAQSAQGAFDFSQSLENLRAGSEMNRAQQIGNLFNFASQGLGGFLGGRQTEQDFNRRKALLGG